MKRLGFLFLCLVFATAMTACGSKPAQITKEQAVQEAAKIVTAANANEIADKLLKELDSELP